MGTKIKFREVITEEGTKLILGKNKEQNEELVKKFLGKNVLMLHTEKPGSPFCIIDGRPEEGDKKIAAVLCARYSQDWRDNKKDVAVHIFNGKDVYKEKKMPVGTFGVKKFGTIIVKKNEILKLL